MISRINPLHRILFSQNFQFTSDPTTALTPLLKETEPDFENSNEQNDYQLLFFTQPDIRGYLERMIPIMQFCNWMDKEENVKIDVSVIPNSSSLRSIPNFFNFDDEYVLMIHKHGQLVKTYQDRWISEQIQAWMDDPMDPSDPQADPDMIPSKLNETLYDTTKRRSLFKGDQKGRNNGESSFFDFPQPHPDLPTHHFLEKPDTLFISDDSDTEIPWKATKNPESFRAHAYLRQQLREIVEGNPTLGSNFFNTFKTPSENLTQQTRTAAYAKYAYTGPNPGFANFKVSPDIEADTKEADDGAATSDEAVSLEAETTPKKTLNSKASESTSEGVPEIKLDVAVEDEPLASLALAQYAPGGTKEILLSQLNPSDFGSGNFDDYMSILYFYLNAPGMSNKGPFSVHRFENYGHFESIFKDLNRTQGDRSFGDPNSDYSPLSQTDQFLSKFRKYQDIWVDSTVNEMDDITDTPNHTQMMIPILSESNILFEKFYPPPPGYTFDENENDENDVDTKSTATTEKKPVDSSTEKVETQSETVKEVPDTETQVEETKDVNWRKMRKNNQKRSNQFN